MVIYSWTEGRLTCLFPLTQVSMVSIKWYIIPDTTWSIIKHLSYAKFLHPQNSKVTEPVDCGGRKCTEVDVVHSLLRMKWSVTYMYVSCTLMTLREFGVHPLLMASTHFFLGIHTCQLIHRRFVKTRKHAGLASNYLFLIQYFLLTYHSLMRQDIGWCQ